MTKGSDQNSDNRKLTDVFVGSRLRDARQRTGASADDIARNLGLPLATYRDAEEGRWRLSATELLTCAELTGVDFSWFFAGMYSELERRASRPIDRSYSAEIVQFRRPGSEP